MSWIVDKLRSSRLAGAIGQIERNEEVDWKQLAHLQALDLVHTSQLFLADRIEAEEAADAQAIEVARSRA